MRKTTVSMKNKIKPIISSEKIAERVSSLAAEINDHYATTTRSDAAADKAKNESVLVVGVLKGAVLFMADLVRELDFSLEMDFIRIASYDAAHNKSTGQITLALEPGLQISNRRVLVVEDIIDSGRSIEFLIEYFMSRGAIDVKTVVLLNKAECRVNGLEPDFAGFKIDDFFAVGYGLDASENLRQLPFIAQYHNG
ncbi:MAG: hypoxanthine phosphoribosyltransferase [Thermoguttaceae bacterium]